MGVTLLWEEKQPVAVSVCGAVFYDSPLRKLLAYVDVSHRKTPGIDYL